jgi:hypothetical protein
MTVKILAIMRPRDGVDVRNALSRHGREELHALWQLYCDGFVREMYSPEGPGAVLILESESSQTAAGRLATLPLIASDSMTLDLIALQPFKAIEMLFS